MKRYILTFLYIITLFGTPVVFAQTPAPTQPVIGEYTVLAPLPGTTKENCVTGTNCKADINSYLSGFLGLVIGIGAVIAMIMLGFYGFQYALSDSASVKMANKDKLWEIVQGLILIISAYAIIYTINPALLTFSLEITAPKITAPAVPATSTSGNQTPPSSIAPPALQSRITQTCPTCGPLTATTYSISQANIDRLICTTCAPMGNLPYASSNLNKNIEPDMNNRLLALNNGLGQQNISWGVTEGYPPVTNHQDNCHYNGTCIDAVIQDSAPTNVRDFIVTANNNGLRAQFEVRTEAEKNSMISRLRILGMSNTEANAAVITVPTINGNHFSVYKK